VEDLAVKACRARGCLATLQARQAPERSRVQQEKDAAVQRWRLEVRAEAARIRDASEAVASPSTYPLAVVPYTPRQEAPLSDARRLEMARHIEKVVAEAEALSGTQPSLDLEQPILTPSQERILGEGCARCRGFCCDQGAMNMAFLTVNTILRFRNAYPGMTTEEVRAAYVGRIRGHCFDNACVYQHVDGCALPREMRSDVCNGYLCEGLKHLVQQWREGAPEKAFLVAAQDQVGIRAAAFVEEGASQVAEVGVPAWGERVSNHSGG
jgi:hypothetical protein